MRHPRTQKGDFAGTTVEASFGAQLVTAATPEGLVDKLASGQCVAGAHAGGLGVQGAGAPRDPPPAAAPRCPRL